MKTPFNVMCKQALVFKRLCLHLQHNPSAPAHDICRWIADNCELLPREFLLIALLDWAQEFRLESSAELESMLDAALKIRGAA